MNEFEGIRTFSSCAGHKDFQRSFSNSHEQQLPFGQFNVNFRVPYNKTGWKALKYILMALDESRVYGQWLMGVSLEHWLGDDGIKWELSGNYTDQTAIGYLAEILERIDCPTRMVMRC